MAEVSADSVEAEWRIDRVVWPRLPMGGSHSHLSVADICSAVNGIVFEKGRSLNSIRTASLLPLGAAGDQSTLRFSLPPLIVNGKVEKRSDSESHGAEGCRRRQSIMPQEALPTRALHGSCESG